MMRQEISSSEEMRPQRAHHSIGALRTQALNFIWIQRENVSNNPKIVHLPQFNLGWPVLKLRIVLTTISSAVVTSRGDGCHEDQQHPNGASDDGASWKI